MVSVIVYLVKLELYANTRTNLTIIDYKSPTKLLSKVLLNKTSVLFLRYKMSKVKDFRN